MQDTPLNAHSVAKSVVDELAPTESGGFEYLWSKYESDRSSLDVIPQIQPPYALGGGEVTLVSLVVIPIVNTILSEAVKIAIKEIVKRLKARRRQVAPGSGKKGLVSTGSAPSDEQIAECIHRHLPESLQGKPD